MNDSLTSPARKIHTLTQQIKELKAENAKLKKELGR